MTIFSQDPEFDSAPAVVYYDPISIYQDVFLISHGEVVLVWNDKVTIDRIIQYTMLLSIYSVRSHSWAHICIP